MVLTPMLSIYLQVLRDKDVFHGQQKRELTVILLNSKWLNVTIF